MGAQAVRAGLIMALALQPGKKNKGPSSQAINEATDQKVNIKPQ